MSELRTSAKLIYLMVNLLLQQGKPVNTKIISKLMELHRNTVNTALKSLEDAGMIRKTRLHSKAGTFGGFKYELTEPDIDLFNKRKGEK